MCLEASIIQGLKHQESFSFVQFQCEALTYLMCQMFKKSVTCSRKLSAISERHAEKCHLLLIDFEPLTNPNERVLHFCHSVHYESEIV